MAPFSPNVTTAGVNLCLLKDLDRKVTWRLAGWLFPLGEEGMPNLSELTFLLLT